MFKYSKTKNNEGCFAIIVSKKINKSAVARNKIRRQISTALRLNLSEIKQAINCVVIPHKHISSFNFQQIEDQIKFFFKHI